MSNLEIIFFVLGVIMLVLVVVSIFLFWYSYKTNKKIDKFLEGGKIKNFKEIFLLQKEKNDNLEEKLKEAFLKIKELENISEKTIQKTGIVRFNPFNEIGGNQSFFIALLDNKNNGFVISSLFTQEVNRVYTKTLKNGKSDYPLSKEEIEAIGKAINS